MNKIKMKQEIMNYVTEHAGTTFVELENSIKGFKDDKKGLDLSLKENVLLWNNVSKRASESIRELLNERKIEFSSSKQTGFCYLLDGKGILLPIAKRPNRDYKKPHWLPVVFNLTKKI